MSEWKWIWWNLGHGPTEKDDEIRELRRELEAVKERELELRRGEWVMKYFDAADEIKGLESDRDRWRRIAEELATGAYSVSYGRLRDALDKYERASTDVKAEG